MPLSDEERRELEEMELELNSEDPRLAQELSSGSVRSATAHTVLGTLTALVGALTIILGVASQLTIVGVFGFLLMGAGTYWIVSTHWSVGRDMRGSGQKDDHSP